MARKTKAPKTPETMTTETPDTPETTDTLTPDTPETMTPDTPETMTTDTPETKALLNVPEEELRSKYVKPLRTQEIKIADLTYDYNVRGTESEIKDSAPVRDIIDSFSSYGQLYPILYFAKDGKNVIFDGHCRFIAAKQIGWSSIQATEIEPIPAGILTLLQISTAVRTGYTALAKTKGLATLYQSNPSFFEEIDAKALAAKIGCNQHTLGVVKRAASLDILGELEQGKISVDAVKALPASTPQTFGAKIKEYLSKAEDPTAKVTKKQINDWLGVISEVVEVPDDEDFIIRNSKVQSIGALLYDGVHLGGFNFRNFVLNLLARHSQVDEYYVTDPQKTVAKGYQMVLIEQEEENAFHVSFNAGVVGDCQLSDTSVMKIKGLLGIVNTEDQICHKSWSEINKLVGSSGLSIAVVYKGKMEMDAGIGDALFKDSLKALEKVSLEDSLEDSSGEEALETSDKPFVEEDIEEPTEEEQYEADVVMMEANSSGEADEDMVDYTSEIEPTSF